ncbi:MAG TPA: hypothetical protein VN692_14880 [Steroidobacteraceae bacterium]|nr:hypothetical protein [Steroidobacteraceae bacterium]
MRLEQNLVPVPGHPVYRDPGLDASSWYNAPWDPSSRMIAPDCVLRVPLRFSGAPRPGAGAGLGFSTIPTAA